MFLLSTRSRDTYCAINLPEWTTSTLWGDPNVFTGNNIRAGWLLISLNKVWKEEKEAARSSNWVPFGFSLWCTVEKQHKHVESLMWWRQHCFKRLPEMKYALSFCFVSFRSRQTSKRLNIIDETIIIIIIIIIIDRVKLLKVTNTETKNSPEERKDYSKSL